MNGTLLSDKPYIVCFGQRVTRSLAETEPFHHCASQWRWRLSHNHAWNLKGHVTEVPFPSFSNIVHMFGLFKTNFTMIHINHHHGFCETTFALYFWIFLDISGWDSLVVWLNNRVWSRGCSLSTSRSVERRPTTSWFRCLGAGLGAMWWRYD